MPLFVIRQSLQTANCMEETSSSMPINLELNAEHEEHEEKIDEDHCTICLQPIVDRTVVPTCSHEFCFECLMVWSGVCPFLT